MILSTVRDTMRPLVFEISSLLLLATLVACETPPKKASVEKLSPLTRQLQVASERLPPPPPIYAKGLTLQQGRHVERIGASIAIFEERITGGGDDPVWNDVDVLNSPETAKAINLALTSGDNSKVMEIGGERAVKFVERLQRLNESLSNIPSNAGIPAFPIRLVIDERDFRRQIAMKQRRIAEALETYPEFSRAYVRWQVLIADAANPK